MESFFREHNVHYQATIDRRIAALKDEEPLTTDESVIKPARLLVELSLAQLRALCTAIARLEEEIDRCCSKLADYKLFASLPGAGPALAPRLLVAFGEHRERFPSAAAFQQYAGVAPVTESSGTSAGCIGAIRARRFCARPSSNGLARQSQGHSGRRPSTRPIEAAEARTSRRCELSHLGGFASSIDAGWIDYLTMNPST